MSDETQRQMVSDFLANLTAASAAPALILCHAAEENAYRRGYEAGRAEALALAAIADQSTAVWSEDRDELLREAWVCWVPDDELVTRLNRLKGPRLVPRDMLLRAINLRSTREVEHREACQRIWREQVGLGSSWDKAITAVYEHIAQADELKRANRRAARLIAADAGGSGSKG